MEAGQPLAFARRQAVSGDGCGMDKQTLSHLFVPFFTTKGLGLKCLYMSGYTAGVIAHRGVLDG